MGSSVSTLIQYIRHFNSITIKKSQSRSERKMAPPHVGKSSWTRPSQPTGRKPLSTPKNTTPVASDKKPLWRPTSSALSAADFRPLTPVAMTEQWGRKQSSLVDKSIKNIGVLPAHQTLKGTPSPKGRTRSTLIKRDTFNTTALRSKLSPYRVPSLPPTSPVPPSRSVPSPPNRPRMRRRRFYRRKKILLPEGYEKADPVNVAKIVVPTEMTGKPMVVAKLGKDGVSRWRPFRKSPLSEVQSYDD